MLRAARQTMRTHCAPQVSLPYVKNCAFASHTLEKCSKQLINVRKCYKMISVFTDRMPDCTSVAVASDTEPSESEVLFPRFSLALRLASAAEVGRSAPEDDSLNRVIAFAAGFSGAVVDAVEALEPARRAVGVDVVSQGAAAVAQGPAENHLDRPRQFADSRGVQVLCGCEGMNPCGEERFIDVDVAQARDQRLVEQRGLDRARGFRQARGQLPRPHLQGRGSGPMMPAPSSVSLSHQTPPKRRGSRKRSCSPSFLLPKFRIRCV
jgi:hypothetical protein